MQSVWDGIEDSLAIFLLENEKEFLLTV